MNYTGKLKGFNEVILLIEKIFSVVRFILCSNFFFQPLMQITAGFKFIAKPITPKIIIKVRKQSNFPIDDTLSTATPRSFNIK